MNCHGGQFRAGDHVQRGRGLDISLFARGLLIGLAIAAPVGAIGLLCIRRTLAQGPVYGFVSGLGAATADAIYGAVAAFGLTAVTETLVVHQEIVRLAGGAFLIVLGVRIAVAQSSAEAAPRSAQGLASAYVSTLALTLANPTTILSFIAIFAGLGLGTTASGRASAVWMIGGVFLGSAAWWLFLSSAIGFVRRALNTDRLRWINRISGTLLVVTGAISLVSLIH